MKLTVTVKGVAVFEGEGGNTLSFRTEERFQGIRNQDGDYVQADDCNIININLSAATAMLCSANDDIALYRCCQNKPLSQRQLAILLMDAKLELQRDFIAAGETLPSFIEGGEERVAEYDMFSTSIIKVTLSPRAQKCLDDALAL